MIGNLEGRSLRAYPDPGHHSLVTPIDWKPPLRGAVLESPVDGGHHSLVTPIDWKLDWSRGLYGLKGNVTTRW